jgi:hypothetical protein
MVGEGGLEFQEVGGEQAGSPRVEHLQEVGMGPAEALTVLTAQSRKPPANAADGGDRQSGEQAPMACIRQAEHVERDFGRPVTGEDAQSDVLVNDAHGCGE